MLFVWFAMGGIWFYTIVAIELILLIWLVDSESPLPAFLSVVVFLFLVHFFGDAQWIQAVLSDPMLLLKYGSIYVVVGLIWGFAKFNFKMSSLRRKALKIREEYDKTTDIEKSEERWARFLRERMPHDDHKRFTSMDGYASSILFWMAYWPVSMFWTLLNDPIKRFFRWVYETFLVGTFTKVHKHYTKDLV